jgi:cytochrome c-type biogenesis protein CcmE
MLIRMSPDLYRDGQAVIRQGALRADQQALRCNNWVGDERN